MIKCPYCGAEQLNDRKFSCGTQVPYDERLYPPKMCGREEILPTRVRRPPILPDPPPPLKPVSWVEKGIGIVMVLILALALASEFGWINIPIFQIGGKP